MNKNRLTYFFFFLLCLLWIANDSVFKIFFPGWITGKISDVIGLTFTPLILTGIFSLFSKRINPIIFFWFSILLTNIIFIWINLSQESNNKFYSWIHSNETMNLADKSDLFLLPLTFFSILIFHKFRLVFQKSIQKKIYILILPIIALINTSHPQGRSDLRDIFFLLNLAHEQIIQLEPKGIEVTGNEFTFKFKFIGKNNESIPVSVEIPTGDATCPKPGDPINEKGNGSTIYYAEEYLGKFQNYKIDFSKSQNFESIEKTSDCSGTECSIDLQTLNPGTYFWKVRTRYLYLSNCQLYLENFLVAQEIHSFQR
ncbi:hypothetical protein EHQ68_04995 [Leptospira congkakensis]|uniref:Uncharacterized protein n=1 Tax=Leptospira congkakensis TaxID=2484932 RepID=A0A4Z1AMM1_9LEPT|nr:hypothetical protein [Leptospira congkakensis]TGL90781.1 hypothetical protein EHQ69_12755 [Leptospira congkakensis]TGL91788.1 hypothetical protein EHQ68_04995 [Leptospira congkakensis]TGL98841.1 hypothetical protein EHQ70_04590 [Leptospira congkakensis]